MLPIDYAGALALPLALMLFTERKLTLLVYYLLAVNVLGVDGLAVATWFWVAFAPIGIAFDMLLGRVGLIRR